MSLELRTANEDGQEKYESGFRYLVQKGNESLHILSCYTGQSFQHLAQCITYDRTSKIQVLGELSARPERRLTFDEVGNVVGVSVICKMPEFGEELEFETYFIGGAHTQELYLSILPTQPFVDNLEIVTYLPEQRKGVEKKLPYCSNIHNWRVFKRESNTNKLSVPEMRLFGKDESDFIEEINTHFPVEQSPKRSLEFQLAGLPYRTYTLGGGKIMPVVCIREYCPYTWIVHYLYQPDQSNVSGSIKLLNSISRKLEVEGNQLIWRITLQELDKHGELFKMASFKQIAEENHYHYQKGG